VCAACFQRRGCRCAGKAAYLLFAFELFQLNCSVVVVEWSERMELVQRMRMSRTESQPRALGVVKGARQAPVEGARMPVVQGCRTARVVSQPVARLLCQTSNASAEQRMLRSLRCACTNQRRLMRQCGGAAPEPSSDYRSISVAQNCPSTGGLRRGAVLQPVPAGILKTKWHRRGK